jgi:MipA family protein
MAGKRVEVGYGFSGMRLGRKESGLVEYIRQHRGIRPTWQRVKHMMHKLVYSILAIVGGTVLTGAESPQTPAAWSLEVGGGVLYAPAFRGSEDYQLMAVPALRVTYGDSFFASVGDGVGYNAVRTDTWTAGPLVKYDFGRESDGENPFRVAGKRSTALRGFADIDGTVQAGAFLKGERDAWSGRLEILQGLNGHEGLTAELGLDFSANLRQPTSDRFVPPLIFATGPRLSWADADYTSTFYGISARDALASGLPAYRAGAGLTSAGWGVTLVQPLNKQLTLVAVLNYSKLVGDAGDSPLVQQRGSVDQVVAGVFVSYKL